MKATSALILLAHGSRVPQTSREMRKLAGKLQRSQKGLLVKAAFLGLIKPDLSQSLVEVALEGVKKVHILPLFLFTGKHVLDDIPALIKASRVLYPEMKLVLHKPIGQHVSFVDFLVGKRTIFCQIRERIGQTLGSWWDTVAPIEIEEFHLMQQITAARVNLLLHLLGRDFFAHNHRQVP